MGERKIKALTSCLVFLILLFSVSVASAVPLLQLDIEGGYYNSGTVIAPGSNFTLYAILNPNNNTSLDGYYLSAAICPSLTEQTDVSPYSFTINNVSPDLIFGEPSVLNGLQNHGGIFDTYYSQIAFNFNPSNKIEDYNIQDNPGGILGGGFVPDANGKSLYAVFDVDSSQLPSGYFLHFDLYSNDKCAPFSHDAEGISTSQPVPEPASILILGSGLVGWALKKKRNR